MQTQESHPTLFHTPPKLQVRAHGGPGVRTQGGMPSPPHGAQPGSPTLHPQAFCHLRLHRSKRSCRPRRWPRWPWGTSTTTRWDCHSPGFLGLGGLLGRPALCSDPVPSPRRASWAPWRPSGGSRAWQGCGGAWAGLCPESWSAQLPSWPPSPLPRPGCRSNR